MEMDTIMPWKKLVREINHKRKKKTVGRKRMDTLLMLKTYCLQQWFNLSDPWTEEMIYDSLSCQQFLDIDIMKDPIPDESTILRFRHFLEENKLQVRFLKIINEILEEKWLLMREGTSVDATIIKAPSSTKNKEWKRDPEMASTKKGNNYYFWMKTHIGTDKDSGLVHTIMCSAANIHDSSYLYKLQHGEEKIIYGDRAYYSKAHRENHEKRWVKYHITKKGSRGKPVSWLEKQISRVLNATRAKVEHIFWVIKNQWWHRKTRYRGIFKNEMQWNMLCWLANIYKVRRKLLENSY